MNGGTPPQPTGYDAEAMFHRRTHEKLNTPELKILDSATVKVRRTSRGIYLDAKRGASGGPEIEVSACDPNTGEVVTYMLRGRLVPPDEEDL